MLLCKKWGNINISAHISERNDGKIQELIKTVTEGEGREWGEGTGKETRLPLMDFLNFDSETI